MKISALIAELQAKLDATGDCEMLVVNTDSENWDAPFSEPAMEIVLTESGDILII